jgi:hypothetical protein
MVAFETFLLDQVRQDRFGIEEHQHLTYHEQFHELSAYR